MARKRLPPTEEDLATWRAAMAAAAQTRARPIMAQPGAGAAAARPKRPRPETPAPALQLLPQDQRALKRGKLAIDARVDLHGMTQAAAHRTLNRFLTTAAERGLRCVLVITGKGAPRADPDDPFARAHGG